MYSNDRPANAQLFLNLFPGCEDINGCLTERDVIELVQEGAINLDHIKKKL